jgi:hypothetical protein
LDENRKKTRFDWWREKVKAEIIKNNDWLNDQVDEREREGEEERKQIIANIIKYRMNVRCEQ